jgi:hypothetical protein
VVPFLAVIRQIPEDASMPNDRSEERVEVAVNKEGKRNRVPAMVTGNARAKNARLRLLKERHENYLAEQRDEDAEAELTAELRVPGSD